MGSVFRNMYKGHMDKTKGGRIRRGRWGCWGGAMWWGGKWRQLYLNSNKKKKLYPAYSYHCP